ncbi:MAG: hypothetical protein LUQ65_10100, partial [Candidatus Helarchaeota archaeon]|nr:hypothetical protein [Candidatus Helarchaeota archaeon]
MKKQIFSKQFKGFSLLVIFSLSLVLTLEMVNINAISNNQELPSNEQNQWEGDSFEALGSQMQRIDFLWSINPALKVNPGLLAIDKFSLL